jgi:hypothetical protein
MVFKRTIFMLLGCIGSEMEWRKGRGEKRRSKKIVRLKTRSRSNAQRSGTKLAAFAAAR